MRFLVLLLLAGCAPITPDAIYATPVEVTVASAKEPRDFAYCVAGALSDAGSPMNRGGHYWIVRTNGNVAYERWDFMPAPAGTIAERRSGQLASSGLSKVKACA